MSPGQGRDRTKRRRNRLTRSLAVGVAVALLASCGGGNGTDDSGSAASTDLPGYYPSDFKDLIKKSKKEGGQLAIYSNMGHTNWAPVFEAFKEQYPWVQEISSNDLESEVVFQRTLAEKRSGGVKNDLMVTNSAVSWASFTKKNPDGLIKYEPPELKKLPKFAKLLPGVLTMSADPMMLQYNSELIDREPKGITDLAKMVSENPDDFKKKIEIRDPKEAFGFTINYAYAQGSKDAWSNFEKLLPLARPENSSGTMAEKLISGEYSVGFFISASTFPTVAQSGGLLKYVYPEEGTVVLPRGIGIVKGAPHPATAKLFLNFVLSKQGQQGVAEGGLASYRDGVSGGEDIHTYQEVVDAVGQDNVIFVDYQYIPKQKVNKFVSRFHNLLG